MRTTRSWWQSVLLLAILLLPWPSQAQPDSVAFRIVAARTPRPDHLELLLELPAGTAPLEARQVQLLEDAQATSHASAVTPFRRAGWTLAVVLAVDTSGSLKQYLSPVSAALPKFVAAVPQTDKVALITFDDTVHDLAPFGAPRDELQARLTGLRASGKRTLLYHALDRSLTSLEALSADRTRRRVIVISDGADESSDDPATADTIIQRAARSRVAIDTIWVGRPIASTRNTLVRLSEQTAGMHGDAVNPAQVDADVTAALARIIGTVNSAVVASFDRQIQTTAATREIGVSVARPGIPPATMALQVPRSAVPVPPAPPPIDRRTIAIRWTVGLLVSLITVYVLYTALYLLVRRLHPEGLRFFPFNPLPGGRRPSPEPVAHVSPIVLPSLPLPSKSPRHTRVANLEPPVLGGSGHGLAIEAVDGPLKGQRIAITGPRFQIGAGNDNDFRIPNDKFLSGMHARFEESDGQWVLFDQGSSNGTFVDGRRLTAGQAVALREGQRVRLGSSEFRVLLAAQASAAVAAPAKPLPRSSTDIVR